MSAAANPCLSVLNAPLMVGGASADITPDLPVRRGGGVAGRDAFYTDEVHSRLTAQSVAWGEGSTCVIWTSCDLGSIQAHDVATFRSLVSAATGVAPSNINISATHSHGAPSSPKFSIFHTESSSKETSATYRAIMEKAAQSAIEAFRNRQPARLGYGTDRVPGACFNRRFIMSNGRASMGGRRSQGLERLQVEGPVDDALQVVWFEHYDSRELLAVLVNLASHPNQMYGNKALGSEYPGAMRETLYRALGSQPAVVFLQGACGNVHTVDLENDPQWGKGLEGIQVIGNLLAGTVIKLLHSSRASDTEGMILGHAQATLELTVREFPAEEVEQTLAIVQQAKDSADLNAYLSSHFTSLDAKARAKQIVLVNSLRSKGATDALELAAARLGDIFLVATPAHQFVEFQIDLKRSFPNHHVILADLTNGSANYVPTHLSIALGGYETEHRLYDSTAGDNIRDASVSLLRSLL